VHAFIVLVLFLGGAVGAWYGFVEDVKIGVLIALVTWAAATFLTFSGNPGSTVSNAAKAAGGVSSYSTGALGLAAVIVAGMTLGGVGVWYGLVEDMEIGFAGGMLLWAGATVAAFRGKIAFR
jgi:hypothetical protein